MSLCIHCNFLLPLEELTQNTLWFFGSKPIIIWKERGILDDNVHVQNCDDQSWILGEFPALYWFCFLSKVEQNKTKQRKKENLTVRPAWVGRQRSVPFLFLSAVEQCSYSSYTFPITTDVCWLAFWWEKSNCAGIRRQRSAEDMIQLRIRYSQANLPPFLLPCSATVHWSSLVLGTSCAYLATLSANLGLIQVHSRVGVHCSFLTRVQSVSSLSLLPRYVWTRLIPKGSKMGCCHGS